MGMIMVVSFMALAVPMLGGALAFSNALMADSQVKMDRARAQYREAGAAQLHHQGRYGTYHLDGWIIDVDSGGWTITPE